MPWFRKKPIVVEAVQFDGTSKSISQISRLTGKVLRITNSKMRIETLEGTMTAHVGDWIIKGVAGECYPCKPAIFADTYEEATQP